MTNVAQRPRFTLGRAHYARRVPGAFNLPASLVLREDTLVLCVAVDSAL